MPQSEQQLKKIGLEVGARISLQGQRKEDRKKRKQDKREQEKKSKKKKQPSRMEAANRQLAQQPSRSEHSQIASSSASTATVLLSVRSIVCLDWWFMLEPRVQSEATQGRTRGALPSI